MHSVYFMKTEKLEEAEWLDKRKTQKGSELSALWNELLQHAHHEFPKIWNEKR